MDGRFDTIIIGSGFGGSVMACRLAEQGEKVLVLERGRRWDVAEYPRRPSDAWIFDPDEPHQQNGWIDMRFYDDMIIAQGAGVGGGSLIYANVSVEAPRFIFEAGWPDEITYDELCPHYATVGEMLDVQELPDGQLTERFRLMREGAEKLGHGDRFGKLPLAVTFDPDYRPDELEDPYDARHSKEFVNAQGQKQGTCVHLANCDIGCDVKAKNTLDLTYIPRAEKHGAEVRPLHVVHKIEPEGSGYRVSYERVADRRKVAGSAVASRVVVAAGSLGSTELLLRCRDQYKTLPRVSRPFLGRNWSSNGDFLTPAFYDDREVLPTRGPTISSAIDFLDGSQDGARYFIEDGGFPDILDNYLEAKLAQGTKRRRYRALLSKLHEALEKGPPLSNVMPWFAQAIDAADGKLYLGRKWYAPWKRTLKLDWEIDRSEPTINGVVEMHKKLSEVTGGDPWVPPTWTYLKNLVTPHPLGGCNMGSDPESGVVDHRGEVFGHPNLFVIDGAIIPEAIGRNPSRTIAALAERSAAILAGG